MVTLISIEGQHLVCNELKSKAKVIDALGIRLRAKNITGVYRCSLMSITAILKICLKQGIKT